MEKTMMLLIALIGLSAICANAIELKPYVSEKISYSGLDITDMSVGSQGTSIPPKPWRNYFDDKNDSSFGNRLAVGLIAPNKKIHGSIRAELEWAWNSKASIKSDMNRSVDMPDKAAIASNNGGTLPGVIADIEMNAFQLNAYYDFDTETKFKPYAGFGIGFAKVDIKTQSYNVAFPMDFRAYKDSVYGLVWNLGLGIAYDITENIALDLGYRYTNYGTLHADAFSNNAGLTDIKGTLAQHDVNLGVRYRF
jgi:opacity protein-like surface antigen